MSRAPYFVLVLCRQNNPTKQWLGGEWPSRNAVIRSQAAIICRARYAGIKPLYRLHVTPKSPSPAHRAGAEG